eukprot:3194918-Amphidinium_carterae.1
MHSEISDSQTQKNLHTLTCSCCKFGGTMEQTYPPNKKKTLANPGQAMSSGTASEPKSDLPPPRPRNAYCVGVFGDLCSFLSLFWGTFGAAVV